MKLTQTLTAVATAGAMALLMSSAASAACAPQSGYPTCDALFYKVIDAFTVNGCPTVTDPFRAWPGLETTF